MKRLALLVVLLSVSASTGGPSPALRRPNVVLITLDTLRQDHVSSYGYARRTTPFLDRLAERRGVRFANAYSTSSWTVPALVSLLTSLDPTTHGIQYGYTTDEDGVILDQRPLGSDLVLLPELLRSHGYQTLGVTASEHLRPTLGFARGFDVYRARGFVPGSQLHAPLHEIAAAVDRSRPFFLWVHYFDPHAPYDSHRPELWDYLDEQPPDLTLLQRMETLRGPESFQALDLSREPAALAYVRAAYDSDVRETDELVARLFQTFHLGADDLIVIAADHGEELSDHGGFGHGHTLFEELLRVPLIVCLPGGLHAGRTVDARVSLLDVLPTILAAIGIEPGRSAQGRNLLPLLEGGAVADGDIHATTGKTEEIESLTIGRFKYVRYLGSRRTMLFDLERDPTERQNLIASHAGTAAELRGRLAELRTRLPRVVTLAPSEPMPAERLEALRSLGYLH